MTDPASTDAARPVAVENFVLCEWATWDQQQRPTIHGLVQRIAVDRLPQRRDVIGVLFDVWGPPLTTVKLRLVIEGPEGSKPFAEPQPFDLPLDEDGIRGVGATLEQLELTAMGDHAVSIHHEGRLLARRRFRVVVKPPMDPSSPTASLQM